MKGKAVVKPFHNMLFKILDYIWIEDETGW